MLCSFCLIISHNENGFQGWEASRKNVANRVPVSSSSLPDQVLDFLPVQLCQLRWRRNIINAKNHLLDLDRIALQSAYHNNSLDAITAWEQIFHENCVHFSVGLDSIPFKRRGNRLRGFRSI